MTHFLIAVRISWIVVSRFQLASAGICLKSTFILRLQHICRRCSFADQLTLPFDAFTAGRLILVVKLTLGGLSG